MYGYGEEDEDNPLRAGMWMDGDSLAPPCGCEMSVISPLLQLLSLKDTDVLFDLGCGDGRICFSAVLEFGVRKAIGVEIEEDVCLRMNYLIGEKKVEDKVFCMNRDLREVDIDEATVIVLYLMPEGIEAVQDKIVKLLRKDNEEGGTGNRVRVLCNTWGFKGWTEVQKVQVCGVNLFVYDFSSLPEDVLR